MAIVVVCGKEDLKAIIKECLLEHQADQASKLDSSTTFTINQVAKNLHRSHSTIKKLVLSGKIACTPDRRITQTEINRYLSGEAHSSND